ncbi:1-acyl-sn-glycerol-3-phosphate acyltransferase [candidate division WOR-3 bacterium]|nr:1-acyl-sn-glycerol-3-phosphate acyltransferase [candidate division WOR-3 bacterium]
MRTTALTRLKRLILIIYGLCIRVRVQGHTGVVTPLKRGFIVAANHLNGADSLILQVALHTRLFFVASRRWFVGPVSRFIMWHLCDTIPVESGDAMGSLAGLRHCIRALKSGGSIGIYPEGVFNRHGRPARVRNGAAYLSIRTGAPILPVYIRNLKLDTEVIGTNRPIECWTGFLSVVENLFNVGIEIVVGDPILPNDTPDQKPEALRPEVRRINGELEREFAQLAAYR